MIEDIKFILEQNLKEGDVRYKRILAGLTANQLRHTAGAYIQIIAFGKPLGDVKDVQGSATRMAILAGFAEGSALIGKGDNEP